MKRFRYQRIDAHGVKDKGVINAVDHATALSILYPRGGHVIALTPEPETTRGIEGLSAWRGRSIGNAEKLALIRELATLFVAKVGLSEALTTLCSVTTHHALHEELEKLRQAVQSGKPFSQALRETALDFPEFVLALVQSGEATGDLGSALANAAEQMMFDEKIRTQTQEALIYPLVLTLTGAGAVLFLFSFVVPRFTSIFKSKRVELPWISEMVLSTGVFFNQYWLWLLMSAVLMGFGLAVLLRVSAWQRALLQYLVYVPIIAPWLQGTETARWTSNLAVLLRSRVPVLQALSLAGASLKLSHNSARLRGAADDVRAGKKLSQAMEDRGLLQGSALTMLKVGEQAGDTALMLGHIAKDATEKRQQLQQRLVALIEPLSILAIGGVIGVVMLGILLALTSLTSFKF